MKRKKTMTTQRSKSVIVAGYHVPKRTPVVHTNTPISTQETFNRVEQHIQQTFNKKPETVTPTQSYTPRTPIAKAIHEAKNVGTVTHKVIPNPTQTATPASVVTVIPNSTVAQPTNTHAEHAPVLVTKQNKKHPAVRTKFHAESDNFVVNGASVRGSSHITTNDPCQDYSIFEDLGNGWAIAITADGAGSCKKSNHGSKCNCTRAVKYFKEILTNYGWIEHTYTPSELEWQMEATKVFTLVYRDACKYAKAKNFKVTDLSATIIVNIITPYGLLVAHIGDGRAGYLNSEHQWVASIIPHKGEEANQTVFLQSNAHSNPGFKMSGVYIPETRIIVDEIKAFTLMSDGCEKATWLCSKFENDMFSDPNKPHAPFMDNVIKHLKATDTPDEDLADILKGGHSAFAKETDDKTIIIGYRK